MRESDCQRWSVIKTAFIGNTPPTVNVFLPKIKHLHHRAITTMDFKLTKKAYWSYISLCIAIGASLVVAPYATTSTTTPAVAADSVNAIGGASST